MAQSTQADITANRNYIYGQGNALTQQQQDLINANQGSANFYQGYGNEVYDPLIGGQGGYSPEEAAAIAQEGGPTGLNNLPTSQTDQQQNFLSPDEAQAIAGNPQLQGQYFDPNATADVMSQNRGSQNAVVQGGADAQNAAVGELQSGLQAPINNPALLESQGYVGDVNSTLAGTKAGVGNAVDLAALKQDPGYAARVRMTPQEQQDIVTGAGITAGTGYRAAAGDLDRQAAAAGLDPAAAAAEKERLLLQGAGESGDAVTQARIGASNAAAAREANIEAGRRAGETSAAQIGSGTALALGNQALSAQDRLEATRLAAQQNVTNLQEGAASEGGEANLATQKGLTATGLQNQENLSGQAQQGNQFTQGLGTQLATNEEQAAAQRAQALGTNRQTTQVGNENQTFGQGMTVNNAEAARQKAIADQQQATAAEGRNWLYGQQQIGNNNVNNAQNRQVGLYGTTIGGANTNTGQQLNKDLQPGLLEKIAGGAIGAVGAVTGAGGFSGFNSGAPSSVAPTYGTQTPYNPNPKVYPGGPQAKGGIFTKPTTITVAEERPEAVIPLDQGKGDSYGRPKPRSGVAPPGLRPRKAGMYGMAA